MVVPETGIVFTAVNCASVNSVSVCGRSLLPWFCADPVEFVAPVWSLPSSIVVLVVVAVVLELVGVMPWLELAPARLVLSLSI